MDDNFTKELKEFKDIIEKLKNSSLPIEESVQLFRRGSELSIKLRDQLDRYKIEITEIKKNLDE